MGIWRGRVDVKKNWVSENSKSGIFSRLKVNVLYLKVNNPKIKSLWRHKKIFRCKNFVNGKNAI